MVRRLLTLSPGNINTASTRHRHACVCFSQFISFAKRILRANDLWSCSQTCTYYVHASYTLMRMHMLVQSQRLADNPRFMSSQTVDRTVAYLLTASSSIMKSAAVPGGNAAQAPPPELINATQPHHRSRPCQNYNLECSS